jgi:hypothetical protein
MSKDQKIFAEAVRKGTRERILREALLLPVSITITIFWIVWIDPDYNIIRDRQVAGSGLILFALSRLFTLYSAIFDGKKLILSLTTLGNTGVLEYVRRNQLLLSKKLKEPYELELIPKNQKAYVSVLGPIPSHSYIDALCVGFGSMFCASTVAVLSGLDGNMFIGGWIGLIVGCTSFIFFWRQVNNYWKQAALLELKD